MTKSTPDALAAEVFYLDPESSPHRYAVGTPGEALGERTQLREVDLSSPRPIESEIT